MHQTAAILGTIAWFRSIRLLSEFESRIVEGLFEPCFEFAEAVKLAESIHIHIKVEDTETLPFDEFVQHGGARANGKVGYVTSKSPRSAGSIRRPSRTAPASRSSSPSARSR